MSALYGLNWILVVLIKHPAAMWLLQLHRALLFVIIATKLSHVLGIVRSRMLLLYIEIDIVGRGTQNANYLLHSKNN